MSTKTPRAPRYHYWPLAQLVLARLREFFREPEAMFWVYGFPILMVVVLGIAFRNKPVDTITVDVEAGPQAQATVAALAKQPRFKAQVSAPELAAQRLRTARTDLVVVARGTPLDYEYRYDATRPESVLARNTVDDALQRAAGRKDIAAAHDVTHTEPGGRYIAFLLPGLLGMSLMGGGMWGVGYVTVDMRIRKLLKRFLATPMKKSQFLGGIMVSRLVFM